MDNFDRISRTIARAFVYTDVSCNQISFQSVKTWRLTMLRLLLIASCLIALLSANKLMAQSQSVPQMPSFTVTTSSGARATAVPAPSNTVNSSKAMLSKAKSDAQSQTSTPPDVLEESYQWQGLTFTYMTTDPEAPELDLTWLSVPPETFTFSTSCSSIISIYPNSYLFTTAEEGTLQGEFGSGPFVSAWISIGTSWGYIANVPSPTTCLLNAYADAGLVASTYIQVPALNDPAFDPGDETDPCVPCQKGGDPISLATGNVSITQPDVKLPGLGGGLQVVRSWNSKWPNTLTASSQGMFGPQWRSTYEERVFVDSAAMNGGTLKYARSDGSFWSFSPASASSTSQGAGAIYIMIAPANGGATLTAGQSYWTISFKNGEKRLFSNASGSLVAIIDRNSNSTRLEYDALGRLMSVTDPALRHLYFQYVSNGYLCTGITSDVGITFSYAYNSSGLLTTVTRPDMSTVSFQYQGSTPLISSVTDSQGKILESHTYDQYGRGLTSSRANGVEAITMTYPATQ